MLRDVRLGRFLMNPVGLLLLSVVLASIGQLCLKAGVAPFADLSWTQLANLLKVLTSPLVIVGFVLYAGSSLAWLIALTRTRLSYAYPFTALTFIFVVLLSRFILKESISLTGAAGIALICLGFLLASH